ncbi:hypothetical protein FRZ61_13800 [Hypericibacter adhaerens]|uniref:VWA domain-containing protein n=1 Tax=Hypericibacter adhaerens TaxID=2602016 RepID=A0A5J6MXM2_9PROT|nr:VWA domain-containing protein [Hypericibacter adhaerens]QEX21455.1 hypothetical protein FRZ61_13800 [Hypericibacter adhaerens]
MASSRDKLPTDKPTNASGQDVAAFLAKLAAVPSPRKDGVRGRLLFGMDATASRQPTWDRACHIQAEMFTAAAGLGGLDIQLAYYRGFGEFKATPWLSDGATLQRLMGVVACLGGKTQIAKLLRHALVETKAKRINAVVFIGDAMEEDGDALCHQAGELGLLGVPLFMFHERGEPVAAETFRQMATLSGGAYCPFDAHSADALRDLLRAVAVFATGGRAALEDHSRRERGAALLLTRQLNR